VASIVASLPKHPVEDLRIDGLRVNNSGGGSTSKDEVPERAAHYLDLEMFGATPAQALCVRHVCRIELGNLRLCAARPTLATRCGWQTVMASASTMLSRSM
jgi:hypothetical protein